jgi:hypothetical protein
VEWNIAYLLHSVREILLFYFISIKPFLTEYIKYKEVEELVQLRVLFDIEEHVPVATRNVNRNILYGLIS